MTITQLEYIVAVDTCRSFVAAAEKCLVTQPTLSMQVQKLEEGLGVKLFNRSKQPITPTEIGIEIIAQARILLAESEKIKEIISDRQQEPSGELKLGIIPAIAPFIMPKILLGFKERFPQVKLAVSELPDKEILSELKLGKIDCCIMATPLHDTTLSESPLYYESFVVYAGKDSNTYKKKHVVPGDIDAEELWLPHAGQFIREEVLSVLGHPKINGEFKRPEYNTGSMDMLKRMVDLYGGITLLPESAVARLSDKHLDKVRYFKAPVPAREISIVTRKSFAKRRLIEALKNEILDFLPKRLKNKKKKEIIKI